MGLIPQMSFLLFLLPPLSSTISIDFIFVFMRFNIFFPSSHGLTTDGEYISILAYLHNILKNHTAHACEGGTLSIECPPRTTVTVLSAFYGRRVPNQYLCPSVNSNATAEEDAECSSPIAVEVNEMKCESLFVTLQLWCSFMYLEGAGWMSGSPVLSHPGLQPSVWTGSLSIHHQISSCLLQVQTR